MAAALLRERLVLDADGPRVPDAGRGGSSQPDMAGCRHGDNAECAEIRSHGHTAGAQVLSKEKINRGKK